ncbi:MAG: holliday junction helicase RuvA [Acidimicrobiaceae bacterium]|jgi:Holliday junction DNA helicase RuvA
MIGSLRGTLVDRSARGEVVVEVGGVGYRATVAPATVAAVGQPGSPVMLYTHLHVREDALTLYGFTTRDDRDCFEALIGAHGVGPALALAILSVHGPAELRMVLAEADIDALTLVPGVGRKTAARLLIELKSRLDVGDLAPEAVAAMAGVDGRSARTDLREALAGLGYEADEIGAVLHELPADGEVQDLLRNALRLLAAAR